MLSHTERSILEMTSRKCVNLIDNQLEQLQFTCRKYVTKN